MRFVSLFALVGLAAASPVVKRAVLPPSQDPFYTPPAGYESKAPGTVLASRQVQTAFLTIIPTLAVQSWQVLYRTTGANGEPLATVATIFKPLLAQSNVLVGFATAYDSSSIDCAPSYNYVQGGSPNNAIVQFEELQIALALTQGWTVVSSDYEGPNASFGAGRVAAHGVLDGLRATLAFAPIGLGRGTKVAQFGYSGGGLATGWAAALQPTYASELNVVGWSIGGPLANITGTVQFLDGTVFSGFGFGIAAGLISAYPSLKTRFAQVATQAGNDAIAYASSHCAVDDLSNFLFKKLQSTTYTTLGDQLFYDPVVQSVLVQNTIGVYKNETPTAPVLIYHSNYDEIIPVADTTALVNRWCDFGIKSLVYQLDVGPSEHATLEELALPTVILFLRDRLAGKTPQSGCLKTDVVLPVPSPTALGPASIIPLTALINAFNQSIGTGDSILKSGLTSKSA